MKFSGWGAGTAWALGVVTGVVSCAVLGVAAVRAVWTLSDSGGWPSQGPGDPHALADRDIGASSCCLADLGQPAQALAGTGPPALRRLVPTDRVDRAILQRQLDRLTPGNVVLDLQALESLDGAQELVWHWRDNHAKDAYLVCWLALEDGDHHGLSAAINVLGEAGCSELHVAWDDAPRATR